MEEGESVEARLRSRLAAGPLTLWATLREDIYETSFGDGYYAYVSDVFLSEADALAEQAEAAARLPEDTRGWYKWHIRRYVLSDRDGGLHVAPEPTEAEPTTVQVLAQKLNEKGLLAQGSER